MRSAAAGPSFGRVWWNSVHMSTCFAAAEGAITATTALSAALVGREVAMRGCGALFVGFALGTLPAPALCHCLGTKRSLVAGLLGLAIFPACFLFAPIVVPAAVLSGVLASLLWTAQGTYIIGLSTRGRAHQSIDPPGATRPQSHHLEFPRRPPAPPMGWRWPL